MALTTPLRPADPEIAPADHAGRGRRRVRRRPGMNIRAVAGATCIALVALVVFSAHRAAVRAPDSRYLIVHPDTDGGLAAGHVLTRDDLALTPLEVGDTVGARLLDDPDSAIGRMLVHRVGPGDLLTASALGEPGVRPGTVEVAVRPVSSPPLQAGDEITVYDLGDREQSARRLADATVVEVHAEAGGIGGGRGSAEVVLGVADPAAIESVLSAASADRIGLVLPRPGGASR